MDWVLVLGMILFGIALIVLETIFIPGTTVVGIIGGLFAFGGVYLSFDRFGSPTGWYVLFITAVALVASVILSFRSKAWQKLALNSYLQGSLYENRTKGLSIGDVGIATSAIKPIGAGLFRDKVYEVSTQGEYVDSQTKIEIINIKSNTIFVKPIIQT